jgi:hypothetical protein
MPRPLLGFIASRISGNMKPRNDPWDAVLPAKNDVSEDVNPYERHRDHPAASLRVTLRSAGKSIFKNDDVVQAGFI